VTGPVRYRGLDYPFTIDAPTLATQVTAALAGLRSLDDDGPASALRLVSIGDRWTVSGPGLDVETATVGAAVARLLEHVNQRAAASVAGVPFHAAATQAPTGGVFALAGTSGAGKSTLGAGAVRAGWGFVADELAAVDPETLFVRPYHRPIGLRRGGAAALGVDYPPDAWCDRVYPWPVDPTMHSSGGTLRAIALVTRGELEPSIEPVEPARALAELVEHTVVPDDEHIVPVFHGIEQIVRRVPVVRLCYDTPADGVELLHRLEREC
jgi:hypothetical protein